MMITPLQRRTSDGLAVPRCMLAILDTIKQLQVLGRWEAWKEAVTTTKLAVTGKLDSGTEMCIYFRFYIIPR